MADECVEGGGDLRPLADIGPQRYGVEGLRANLGADQLRGVLADVQDTDGGTFAKARPIPLPAPVMMMALPESRPAMVPRSQACWLTLTDRPSPAGVWVSKDVNQYLTPLSRITHDNR